MGEIFVVIQARTTSSRLPKKVLEPLFNAKNSIEIMIERLKRYKNKIILATPKDHTLKQLAKKLDIRHFASNSDENDVLSRIIEAVQDFGAKRGDNVVRLTSDCPFVDEHLLRRMILQHKKNRNAYTCNTIQRTYPRGLDIEIMGYFELKSVGDMAISQYQREHVTPYFYENEDLFKVQNITQEKNLAHFRLTLDEEADLRAIKEWFKVLKKTDFMLDELQSILQRHSHIAKINEKVEQKS